MSKVTGRAVAKTKNHAGSQSSFGGRRVPNKSNVKKRVVTKQPKARTRRVLKAREPKLIEGAKHALMLKGSKCPEVLQTVLRDLMRLLKPNARMLNRKHEIRPFEDPVTLEFLMDKNECGLFALGHHSKKRPHNLIMGRTYDSHLLDMVEFAVSSVAPLEQFKGVEKKRVGSKPCLFFAGEGWEQDSTLGRIKSLFIEFFRVEDVSQLSLAGVDSVTSLTAMGEAILLRNYHVRLSKTAGSQVPKAELQAMGPCFTLTIRRTQLASPDLWRTACKMPKHLKPKKVKNESRNPLGDKLGRVHVGRQDLDSMRTKRVKALRSVGTEGLVGALEEGEEPMDSGDDGAEEEGGWMEEVEEEELSGEE